MKSFEEKHMLMLLEDELICEYIKAGDLTKDSNFEPFALKIGNIVKEYIEENYEFEYTEDAIIRRRI